MRRTSIVLAALTVLGTAAPASANEGGASFFVRADTDRTVVISPRAFGSATFDGDRTTIRAAYMADVWTSASIDIRTAASYRRPRQPNEPEPEYHAITEQRDQIDLSVSHELDDVTIGGSYYYSGENDYWSHGFTLRSEQELPGNATTLEESLLYVHDIVGRAGDPTFERPLDTFGLRLVLTQILTPEAILQFVYDGSYRTGFQSSPYRYVGLGGDGQCGGTAVLCVPEAHPSTRIRSALVARGRFAFGQNASAGLDYRFYVDDWGVLSHTARAQIAWIPERGQTITLLYRFYTQSAAGFYMSTYPNREDILNVTRDRELSPLFSNRLALSYQGRTTIAEGVGLKYAVAVGGSAFVYPDFVGLEEVYSLDVTASLTLEL
ncbi:MAG: DUF3570 domain-containing protein [Sandaracinaceae bacterium]